METKPEQSVRYLVPSSSGQVASMLYGTCWLIQFIPRSMISVRLILPPIDECPPPPPDASQHLKLAGPGHRLDTVVPEHWLVQRQFPPLPQLVLVQHLTSSGVPGQAPVM